MPAKDYTLAVTPLTNTVWICKPSRRDKNCMTDDRAKVDESHFIGCILDWMHNKIDDDQDTLEITVDGKVVANLKIDRVALGLKEAPSTKVLITVKKSGNIPETSDYPVGATLEATLKECSDQPGAFFAVLESGYIIPNGCFEVNGPIQAPATSEPFVDERQFLREAKEYDETGYVEPEDE